MEYNIGDIYRCKTIPTFKTKVTSKTGKSKVCDTTGSTGWSLGDLINLDSSGAQYELDSTSIDDTSTIYEELISLIDKKFGL